METTMILWVGDYMTGKTVGAATFPKPMIFCDFDNHVQFVKNARDKAGKPIVSEEEFKGIDVLKYNKENSYKLNFKTVLAGAKGSPDYAKESTGIIDRFNTLINDIKDGKVKCETLVIDSVTVMFRLWREAILAMNNQPQVEIQDYGTLGTVLFSQFLPTLKSLPVKYVICIGHTDMEKDKVSGRVIEFPVGPSKNQGRGMGKEFHEVWRQEVQGDKYVIRTQKGGNLMQVGSRSHIPDGTEARWEVLSKFLV